MGKRREREREATSLLELTSLVCMRPLRGYLLGLYTFNHGKSIGDG
jgi:hypothetical protein